MHITSLASGSGGNCALVSFNGTHILIDMGISLKRLRLGLKELGISPSDIHAVLVSHEHSDHISGLAGLSKYHGVPILAPPSTAEVLHLDEHSRDYVGGLRFGEDFRLGDISVRAFRTPHDTPQSAGFRLWTDDGESFGFCTDLGHVSGEVLDNLAGSKTVMLESNHDADMLRRGPYPAFLKRRILSDHGHLSNDSGARLAVQLAESGASSIVLAHLSAENNDPSIAFAKVSEALGRVGFGNVSVKVASPTVLMELTSKSESVSNTESAEDIGVAENSGAVECLT